jgi:hypothetical protein
MKVLIEVSFSIQATHALMAPATMLNASLVQYISTNGLIRLHPPRLCSEPTLRNA